RRKLPVISRAMVLSQGGPIHLTGGNPRSACCVLPVIYHGGNSIWVRVRVVVRLVVVARHKSIKNQVWPGRSDDLSLDIPNRPSICHGAQRRRRGVPISKWNIFRVHSPKANYFVIVRGLISGFEFVIGGPV